RDLGEITQEEKIFEKECKKSPAKNIQVKLLIDNKEIFVDNTDDEGKMEVLIANLGEEAKFYREPYLKVSVDNTVEYLSAPQVISHYLKEERDWKEIVDKVMGDKSEEECRENYKEENIDINKCIKKKYYENIKLCEAFIRKYPESKYKTNVERLLNKQKLKLEEEEYKIALAKNSYNSYKKFIEKYPNSKYKNIIIGKIKNDPRYQCDKVGYIGFLELFRKYPYLVKGKCITGVRLERIQAFGPKKGLYSIIRDYRYYIFYISSKKTIENFLGWEAIFKVIGTYEYVTTGGALNIVPHLEFLMEAEQEEEEEEEEEEEKKEEGG
ncbi:MAG: hypothetical protein QXI58_08295, partial [Candidatus Micrarchaeia archaeon]